MDTRVIRALIVGLGRVDSNHRLPDPEFPNALTLRELLSANRPASAPGPTVLSYSNQARYRARTFADYRTRRRHTTNDGGRRCAQCWRRLRRFGSSTTH